MSKKDLTKKDFVIIAQALGLSLSESMVSELKAKIVAGKFTQNIAHTNEHFDRERFFDAVMASYNKGF